MLHRESAVLQQTHVFILNQIAKKTRDYKSDRFVRYKIETEVFPLTGTKVRI